MGTFLKLNSFYVMNFALAKMICKRSMVFILEGFVSIENNTKKGKQKLPVISPF